MTRYVALLRGIGPATHGKMPLGALADKCAAAGLLHVANVGNTGNLVFGSNKPQGEVEMLVTEAVTSFGLGSEVFTRTERQLAKLLELAPFPDAAAERPGRLGVAVIPQDDGTGSRSASRLPRERARGRTTAGRTAGTMERFRTRSFRQESP